MFLRRLFMQSYAEKAYSELTLEQQHLCDRCGSESTPAQPGKLIAAGLKHIRENYELPQPSERDDFILSVSIDAGIRQALGVPFTEIVLQYGINTVYSTSPFVKLSYVVGTGGIAVNCYNEDGDKMMSILRSQGCTNVLNR